MASVALVLPDAQLLNLSVRRGGAAYPGSVQLLASGQSALLAGVNRVAEIAKDFLVQGVRMTE